MNCDYQNARKMDEVETKMRRFHRGIGRTIFFCLFFCIQAVGSSFGASYVGSEACLPCHQQQYNDFILSGHSLALQKVDGPDCCRTPLPEGYSWHDISYVVGGLRKKANFLNREGYVVTAGRDGAELKTQYNIETGSWAYFFKDEKRVYDCGRCHTTGYNPAGHQDGQEGILGTWAKVGVQCERCHGPGSEHCSDGDKKKITVDRTVQLCGECHSNGDKSKVPTKVDYVLNHAQSNELAAGGHAKLVCVTCHNPHKAAKFSILEECRSCHREQAKDYIGSTMDLVGVTCVDCHMAKAVKTATMHSKFNYDTRSHLFTINPDAKVSMFYDEDIAGGGKVTYARGFITVDFACLGCHQNKDPYWAAFKSKGVHGNKRGRVR